MKADIDVIGIKDREAQFKAMLSSDPNMRKRFDAIVRKVVKEAAKSISKSLQSDKTVMQSDPRQAFKAVRSAVYRRIIGGNVNILGSSGDSGGGGFLPFHTPRTGRGGNRWGISERTKQLMSYTGTKRGFILRFLNAGTDDREIRSYTGKDGERHSLKSGSGNRKRIAPRNFFGSRSQQELEKAAADIESYIDAVIEGEFF